MFCLVSRSKPDIAVLSSVSGAALFNTTESDVVCVPPRMTAVIATPSFNVSTSSPAPRSIVPVPETVPATDSVLLAPLPSRLPLTLSVAPLATVDVTTPVTLPVAAMFSVPAPTLTVVKLEAAGPLILSVPTPVLSSV